MSVLVLAEHRNGELKKTTFEALTAGRSVADKLGTEVCALLLGDGVDSLASELGKYGADKVLVGNNSALQNYSTEGYAEAIQSVVSSQSATVILLSATALGKDLAPRLCAKIGAGLAADVTELDVADGKLVAKRPVYAGKSISKVEFNSDVQVASLRPNVFTAQENAKAGAVESVDVNPGDIKALVKDIVAAAGKKMDLSEANIVVSGGRGLKEAENFNIVENLAEVLGAAVGASRAVVDAGWRPHSEQVGQTGKTVSPTLYIAIAISGAIQHLAGMSSSKFIVAINKDADAPIFKVANYGIVGDAFEVVPTLTEELKKVLV
ncbi:MAG: electron transfer flavoprotein subunit alpha/FixB family protein [Calditrichaeota bacterium]|nr:MAG: electron transfer flavoprotein subunit alpha/FixB family protein [Calditrichota bacterium]